VGREDSAPKSDIVADADALSKAEGSIWTTASARSLGAAGVLSPGHAITGLRQELGRPPSLLLQKSGVVYLTQKDRAVDGTGARADGANKHLVGGSTRSRETRDRLARGWRGVLRTHGTDEGGECRGRSGRPAGGTGGTNERIGWRKHDDTQRSRKHVNEAHPNS